MCNRLDLTQFEQTLDAASMEQLAVLSNYIESKLGDNMTQENTDAPEAPVEATDAPEVVADAPVADADAPVAEDVVDAADAPTDEATPEEATDVVADIDIDYKAEAERLQGQMDEMKAKHDEAIVALSSEKETVEGQMAEITAFHSSEIDAMSKTLTAYKRRVLADHADALSLDVIEAASEFVAIGDSKEVADMTAETVLKVLNFAEKAGSLAAHSASAGAEETERNRIVAGKKDDKNGMALENDFGWLTAHHKKKMEKN